MLYRPEDFHPLTETPWREERVRAGIRAIVADTDSALRGSKLLWRANPWDRWKGTSPLKDIYVGAAGVLWALDALRRRGHAETRLDLADLALSTLHRQRTRPDLARVKGLPEPAEAALLSGEAGILLTAYRVSPSRALADDLYDLVRANVANEADEVMWGSPGSLLAAERMLEWTGDERWRDAWNEGADALFARREADGLWTQRLYGMTERFLGPVHGLVGNVFALERLLDEDRRSGLFRETAAILERTAVVEDGLANWPPVERERLESTGGEIRVQWCHGSPGMVWAASSYLDKDLVVAGAELTWRAGAHRNEKGASICHGTAGNGYALLAAFERTGDERWLERARRFAVHALEQARRIREESGTGRYSLFTGDLGVALFAADCLEARTAFPIYAA
ncbi:MAG TPA: LanC-like protein [Gaiellaceae bacterium]|nr:LanC-like protein [Gaiellaceae bacterium]